MTSAVNRAFGLVALAFAGSIGVSFPAVADGPAVAIEDIAATPDMLLTEPSTEWLVRDGDETVVDTVFIYLDGCPLLSLSPGASKTSPPNVTMIDPSEGCAAVATQDPVVSPAAALEGGAAAEDGLLVRMRNDEPAQDWGDDTDQILPVADHPRGRTLIVDIASLVKKGVFADVTGPGGAVAGPVAPFEIPAILGGPSGLIPVSGTPGDFGNAPGFGTGGGNFVGGGGSGSGSGGGSGGGLFPGSTTPQVAAVPLPYTLILLLAAFYALRRVAYRR